LVQEVNKVLVGIYVLCLRNVLGTAQDARRICEVQSVNSSFGNDEYTDIHSRREFLFFATRSGSIMVRHEPSEIKTKAAAGVAAVIGRHETIVGFAFPET